MAARPNLYRSLIGMAVGALLAGLVLPFAVSDGSPESSVEAVAPGGRSPAPSEPDTEASALDEFDGAASADDSPEKGEEGGEAAAEGPAGAVGGSSALAPRGSTGQSGSPGASGATATDRGVTADAIKLGVMILNVGNAERLGVAIGVNPEQQRRAWRAYVDELNEAGGIHGRKINPVFAEYDVTRNESQRAACLQLTEDQQVFAVLDLALVTAAALCVTQEHGTPLITFQPMPRDVYAKSEGRLVTLFSEGTRMWRNVANDLHSRGALKGKTIGVLGDTAPGTPETMDALEAELKDLGYSVAHRSRLSSDGSTGELHQAASQIPIEVQEMRRRNVDLVLMAIGTIEGAQFVQAADSQRYHPGYIATDWRNAYSDSYAQNMPESFDGSLITSNRTGEFRTNRPEPETERRCRRIYERRTGEMLDRSTTVYNSTVRFCSVLEVFAKGATAATVNLTRATLSTGLQGLGPMPLATFGGASLRPGKFDAADLIRTARFNPDCDGRGANCWVPADEFRPPRYR